MCIQAMSVTARLLSNLCGCECAESLDQLTQLISAQERIVFDVQDWLLRDTSTQDLPQTWDVTSDSIAARLAKELRADELVLLKSQDAPCQDSQRLSDVGYVDPRFPHVACGIPRIRYVNLR